MKITQKILLSTLLIAIQLFAFQKSNAQLDTILRNHVVFVIDGGVSMTKGNLNIVENLIRKEIPNFISDNKLLKEGDMLSFLNYSLMGPDGGVRNDTINFTNYFHLDNSYISKKKEIGRFGFVCKDSLDKNIFNQLADTIIYFSRNQRNFFSPHRWGLPYMGKNLIISYFNFQKDVKYANRFIVISISNKIEFEASNYTQELNAVKNRYKRKQLLTADIEKTLKITNNLFEQKKLYEKDTSIYHIEITEFTPILSNFHMFTSNIFIPESINFQRTTNGFIHNSIIDCKKNKSEYTIKKVQLSYLGIDKKDTIFFVDANKDIPLKINLSETDYNKDIKLELKFWVQYKDGIYNYLVLSPYVSEQQGKNGLNYSVNIEFDKHAKIIGVFPMSNSMYKIAVGASSWLWGSKQKCVVWFWNIVFGILIIGILYVVFIRVLKLNIDKKGKNAKIINESEEPKSDVIEFDKDYENDFHFLRTQTILITNKKGFFHKVNYNHYLIKTQIINIPKNLLINKENLIFYKLTDNKDEKQKKSLESLNIKTGSKNFKIGLNRQAVKDYYNFKDSDMKRNVKFEIHSYSFEKNNKSTATYYLNLKLKKQLAKFELSESNFISTSPKGIEFKDSQEYSKHKIGEIILSNNSTKAYAENINLKNISISDERIFFDFNKIQAPYIYTIDENVFEFIKTNIEDTDIEELEKRLLGNNYITEGELLNAVSLNGNNKLTEQLMQIAKCDHPLYEYEKSQDKGINVTLPGKSTVIVPVFADILKFGNPDTKQEEIEFELSGYNGKEEIKQAFSFILIKDDNYSELVVVVQDKELESEDNFTIKDVYDWNKSQGEYSFFTFNIGNKAKKHETNKAVTVRNLKFNFSVVSNNINQIIPESPHQFKDIFSVYHKNNSEKNLLNSDYIYKEKPYFNNENIDSYIVILHNNKIQDIPHNSAKIKCEITYIYANKNRKHEVVFTIKKDLGEKWLALDLGTSAIVAAFTHDIYQKDNSKMLLDMHSSLYKIITAKKENNNVTALYYEYHKENIEEFDLSETQVKAFFDCKNNGSKKDEKCKNLPDVLGNMISSTIMLNENGELDAKTYDRNIINISPTVSQIKNKTENIIPYLKSLIGADELEGYIDYNYYNETMYYYDVDAYAKLEKQKEKSSKEFAFYLQQIKETFGHEKFTQKQFESKLRQILQTDYLFDEYKHDFIGEFTLPYDNLKKELSKPEYNGQLKHLNMLRDKKFVFFSDYIYKLKKLLTKQNFQKDENKTFSESEIKALIRNDKHEKRIANFDVRKSVKHIVENEYVNNKIKIKTILQNTYESIFRDFIFPQVKKQYGNTGDLSSVLNKIILTYPNTFSPLHIKHIKEDVILQQFPEFDKKHIKFISESDAVAIYYAGNMYNKNTVKPEYVLVYDMGAGTLDITYFLITRTNKKTNINIIGKSGKTTAGNYLDRLLAEYIYMQNKDKFITELFPENKTKTKEVREHSIILKNYIKKIIKPNLYKKSEERQEEDEKIKENYEKIVNYSKQKQTYDDSRKLYKNYTKNKEKYNKLNENLNDKKSAFEIIKKQNKKILDYDNKIKKIEEQQEIINNKEEEIKNIFKRLGFIDIHELKTAQVNNQERLENLSVYKQYQEQKDKKDIFEKHGSSIEDIEKTLNNINENETNEIFEILEKLNSKTIIDAIDKAKYIFRKVDTLFNKLKTIEQVKDEHSLEQFVKTEEARIKSLNKKLNNAFELKQGVEISRIKDVNQKIAIIINQIDNLLEYVPKLKNNLNTLLEQLDITQIRAQRMRLEKNKKDFLKEKEITEVSESEWIHQKDNLNITLKEQKLKLQKSLTTKENDFKTILNNQEKALSELLKDIKINKDIESDIVDIKKQLENIEKGENIIYISKSSEQIGKIIKDNPFEIDLNKLIKSDTIKNYIQQNTIELMNEFYEVYEKKISKISGKENAFPINKIVLTGRGSQLVGLRERMGTMCKNDEKAWDNINNIDFITFGGDKKDELKTIVANGALYYAMQLNSGRSDFSIESDNLNAVYGVLYKRKYKWEFLPLLKPGKQPLLNKPHVENGFWLYKYLHYENFDFLDVTNFQFIQTYVSNPVEYLQNDRQEYYTTIESHEVARYAKNTNAGIGIEIDLDGELHFYIYKDLKFIIPFDFIAQLKEHLPEDVIKCLQDVERNTEFASKEDMEKFLKEKLKNKHDEYIEIILKCTLPSSGIEATKLQMSKLNKLTENKAFKYSVWPYLSYKKQKL